MASTTLNTRIVLRNDSSANWLLNESQILLKGEVGIEFIDDGSAKIKIGDGVKTWSELPYFGGDNVSSTQVFQAELQADEDDAAAIARVVGSATLQSGDIAIVKALITGDKYTYTAYVYDGTKWAAMDGNYSATNVYFPDDMMVTKEIGYITLTNGQGTIPSKGKNIEEVFEAMFVKESNPSTVQPSAGWDSVTTGSFEVGTTVTPSWDGKLNVGSYTYGPATGVTATAYAISNNVTSETATTETGAFNDWTVADGVTYKITEVITHTEGTIPVTNKGNEYTAGKITAGTKTAVSSGISGYRNSFYGTLTEKGTLDSATIRGLTKSGKALSNGSSFTISIPVGAYRVVIAYPSTLRDLTSVLDKNDSNANIVSGFGTPDIISVEGANSYSAIDYKVYKMDFANAYDTANTFTVTI